MQLRPYQSEAIDAVFDWWGTRPPTDYPLIVLPTASGKTVVFSSIIKLIIHRWPQTRILVIAHRQELVEQAEDKILKLWPDAPVGVYCAGLGRKQINSVTVASRDSILRNVHKLGKINLIIIDEAHNISPKDNSVYQKIIATAKETSANLNVLGFTATPFRGNKLMYGAGELFEHVCYEVKIKDLIDQGYLCRVTARGISHDAEINTDGIKTSGDDYNQKELSDRATDIALVDAAIDDWYTLAYKQGRRSTVFYCVSVDHADLLAERLAIGGIDISVVTGETPKTLRRKILEDVHSGRTIGVINVGVLTEGWDAPIIDCIVILRPTRSITLYLQMVGRGLRLHPDKENTLVLDFGGCIDRFGPIDLVQPTPKRKKQVKQVKPCPGCDELVSIYKIKCPNCDYELKPPAVRICTNCGEGNPPSASKCLYCDAVFVSHDTKAKREGILSDDVESMIITEEVTNISACKAKSRKSGKEYLRLTYHCGLTKSYTRVLCLGYEGVPGKKASLLWREVTKPDVPSAPTPDAAMKLIDQDRSILKRPESILINNVGKYPEIVRVNYPSSTKVNYEHSN